MRVLKVTIASNYGALQNDERISELTRQMEDSIFSKLRGVNPAVFNVASTLSGQLKTAVVGRYNNAGKQCQIRINWIIHKILRGHDLFGSAQVNIPDAIDSVGTKLTFDLSINMAENASKNDFARALKDTHRLSVLLCHEMKHVLDHIDGVLIGKTYKSMGDGFVSYMRQNSERRAWLVSVINDLKLIRGRVPHKMTFEHALGWSEEWKAVEECLRGTPYLNKFKAKLAAWWNSDVALSFDSGSVLYHGTDKSFKEFSRWQPNFFSQTPDYSLGYIGKNNKGVIIQAKLDVKNPFDTRKKECLDLYNNAFLEYALSFGPDARYQPLSAGEIVPFTTADMCWSFLRRLQRTHKATYDALFVDEHFHNTPFTIVPLNVEQIHIVGRKRL